ncbi:glycosyltransferase family 4 protein [Luedemannella flava]|uniref:Glycosyltransferase family 4 protein n=1 Tax=Luedemannella flava TaxID=349316 RepID=A0ABP4YZ86_9ACTN
MKAAHLVVPAGVADPAAPSGGNVYDRRVARGLADAGWSVRGHPVGGGWPRPDPAARSALSGVLGGLPDGSVVLVDGIVASAAPAELAAHAGRLRLVGLVHMVFGDAWADLRAGEREALSTMAAVVTTSGWSRDRLGAAYGIPWGRLHVAPPGVDAAPVAPGSPSGGELLCVAVVAPHKGHDVLVSALARLGGLSWRLVCVGALDRDPAFVDGLSRRAATLGVADRISFVGPAVGADLDARYAAADLLVLASRGETYGMVVAEALARGTPVVATDVGGVPEALGRTPDGDPPGLLVPPDDPDALAGALRRWLTDPALRDNLRTFARTRRTTQTGWAETARLVSCALTPESTNASVAR